MKIIIKTILITKAQTLNNQKYTKHTQTLRIPLKILDKKKRAPRLKLKIYAKCN